MRTNKKPTKRERNRIYKAILALVQEEGWVNRGFCVLLSKANYEADPYGLGGEGMGEGIEHNYPEIWKGKPKGILKYSWFRRCMGSDKKRENILKLAIKETSPKPKKNVTHRRKTSIKG